MITPRSWLCHFQILVTSCVMLCDTGVKPYWMARMPMSRSMLWRNMYYTLYSTLLMVQMESLTMQQGDYNVPATYQTLMNHILYWSLYGCTYIWLILLSTQTLWMSIESSTYRKYLRSCAMKSFSWAWQRCNFFASGDLHILGHIINRVSKSGWWDTRKWPKLDWDRTFKQLDQQLWSFLKCLIMQPPVNWLQLGCNWKLSQWPDTSYHESMAHMYFLQGIGLQIHYYIMYVANCGLGGTNK